MRHDRRMDEAPRRQAPLKVATAMIRARHVLTGAIISLTVGVGACRTSGVSQGTPATDPREVAYEAAFGSRGDTARFGVKVVDVMYAPDRSTYELARPAYVTVLSVASDRIAAIAPATGKSELVGSGSHTIGLDREAGIQLGRIQASFRNGRLLPDDASAAQVRDYNRCLTRARGAAAQRREARRPIVGYDSSGKAIYGPPPLIDAPGDVDLEVRCRIPPASGAQAAPRVAAPSPKTAGRYLLIFASDTPIETRDIEELVVNESDVRSITLVVGQKLFGVRGANWSVTFRPW